MMHIQKVRLENIGPFQLWEREFDPGVTAIIGANGAGKSTLLQSIYAAFSNDFSRSYGVKSDTVSLLAGPDAPSNIRVWASHAGTRLEVERRLQPNGSELLVHADGVLTSKFRKAEEIAKELERILNLPLSFLDDYVFVDQWAIFGWMMLPPADRAKAFQRLFRTDVAERCWEAVGVELASLPVATQLADDEPLKQSLAAAATRLEQSGASLEQLIRTRQSDATVAGWRQTVEKAKQKEALLQQADALSTRLAGLEPAMSEMATKLEVVSNNLDLLREEAAASRAAAETAHSDLGVWQAHLHAKSTKESLEQRLQQLQADRREVPQVVSVEWLRDSEQQLAQLATDLQVIETFLKTFDPASGRSECPTCGTPVTSLADKYEKYRQSAGELRSTKSEFAQLVADARRTQTARAQYDTWLAEHDKQLAWTAERIAAIVVPEPPSRSQEELQKAIVAVQQAEQQLGKSETIHRELLRKYDQVQAEIQELQRQIAHNTSLVDTVEVESGMVNLAKVYLEEHEAAGKQLAAAGAEHQANQRAHDELQKLVTVREEASQKTQARRVWENRLNEVRQVLHRDALPRIVAQNYLEILETDINELLVLFDAPFRVKAQEGLSFLVRRHDGREHDMRRLSGGQKVVLALAFRVAVNALFADELGLLCLDEPTAGLDRQNLKAFEAAIDRLQDMARSRGLQCFIVTHEEWLAGMFTNVIQLP